MSIRPCDPEWIDNPNPRVPIQIKPDGSFDANGILPGKYCVEYSRRDSSLRVGAAWAEQIITVIDRNVSVAISPQAPKDILGVIAGANNSKIPTPLQISLQSATDAFVPLVTGQAGRTSNEIRFSGIFDTDYSLGISPAPGTYVTSIRRGNSDLTDAHLFPGEFGALVIELAKVQNRVYGRVKAVAPNPLGFAITVYPADRPWRRDNRYNTWANSRGDFELSDLAPGTYNLYAWERFDGSMSDPKFLKLFSPTVLTVEESGEYKVETKLITPQEVSQAREKPLF